MLKTVITISAMLLILAGAAFVLLQILKRRPHQNFGTMDRMADHFSVHATRAGNQVRSVTGYYNDFDIPLHFPISTVMNSRRLAVDLKAWESDRVYNRVISRFVFDDGNASDLTFLVRPKPEVLAPLLFGDLLTPMAGVKSSFYMDLYCTDKSLIDVKQFFGDQMPKIEQALNLVRIYQKTDDRGKLTGFLDQYKSPYRMELNEPVDASLEERQAYYEAVFTAFALYLEAFETALGRAEVKADRSEKQLQAMNDFIDLLWERDSAVKMGRMLFSPEELEHFFLKAFWRRKD